MVPNYNAHGLKAYFHDCLMSEKDRIDNHGNPVNYMYAKLPADRVICHQKRKRCLAMARWCASRSLNWICDPADEVLHKSDFYDKWKLRWRELADKFKEAK